MGGTAFFLTMFLTLLLSGIVSGQQKPTTGYAPVNGLKMYYKIHGSSEPVVLLHGAFMAISGEWSEFVGQFADGKIPEAFKVTESQVSPIGIFIVSYERDGDVKTGAPQIKEDE